MTSAPLPTPATNAAKWFATGRHGPAKRLNARRVAGTSVPRSLLAHRTANHQAITALTKAQGVARPLQAVRLDRPQRLAPVQVGYHFAPPQPPEFWCRSPHGPADIALSCIAHLVPDERLSLLPLFLALEAAAPALSTQGGSFPLFFLDDTRPDPTSRAALARAAQALTAAVRYHALDSSDPVEPKATLAHTDIFAFPSPSQMSALTRAHVGASPRALVTLAADAGLRAPMAAAGQARALYDLSALIPQIQALWGERAAMRPHASGTAGLRNADPANLPIGPATEQMFEGHLTHPAPDRATRHLRTVATNPRPELAASFARHRRQPPDRSPRPFAAGPCRLRHHRPNPRNLGQGSALTALHPHIAARATLWLARYHFQEDTP